MPSGIAATSAWACSVVLAIMSMSQVWYVGHIAMAAGGAPYGVDLGWCNSFGLALILYPPFRYLELKYSKVAPSVTETAKMTHEVENPQVDS